MNKELTLFYKVMSVETLFFGLLIAGFIYFT